MIFFLSGVAGLGYEIVWTRMFSIGLGHEMPSMLAVVGAFFFGLAIGSVVFDGVISRSPRPGRWYVGCELVIGIWAIVEYGSDSNLQQGRTAIDRRLPIPGTAVVYFIRGALGRAPARNGGHGGIVSRN